ncbi:MAG: helix-turn-helix transcriptional regulator [Lachnospiraceae bacterium]|nr:helix-turn-helix transcriptional regulator [Lachnospiraceae bacterium]
MFNMKQIGKKITELRKINNLTQMELADQLGISFQAVSNWERGNTMPDISKLPELAEIFHISVDELLGSKAPLLESVLDGTVDTYIEESSVSEQEVADTLPLLKPDQTEELLGKIDITSFSFLSSLIPFMDDDTLRDVAMELAEQGDDISDFLPHMDEDDVSRLAMKAFERNDSIDDFLPFMNEADIEHLADCLIKKGDSVDECFPFLDEEAVTKIAYKLLEKNDSVCECLPFMDEDAVYELAMKAVERDYSIDDFLPFIAEENIARLALNILRNRKK